VSLVNVAHRGLELLGCLGLRLAPSSGGTQ